MGYHTSLSAYSHPEGALTHVERPGKNWWSITHSCPIMQKFDSLVYNYTVSQKGVTLTNGCNFVNFWSICKILSLLRKVLSFQQNAYCLPTTPELCCYNTLENLKNRKFSLIVHVKHVLCDFYHLSNRYLSNVIKNTCKD